MSLPSGLSVAMMSIRFRVVALLTLIGLVGLAAQSSGPMRQAPRFWNDRELAEWATPIAALDVRPSHFSEREDHAAPAAEWVRTYPCTSLAGNPRATGRCCAPGSPSR